MNLGQTSQITNVLLHLLIGFIFQVWHLAMNWFHEMKVFILILLVWCTLIWRTSWQLNKFWKLSVKLWKLKLSSLLMLCHVLWLAWIVIWWPNTSNMLLTGKLLFAQCRNSGNLPSHFYDQKFRETNVCIQKFIKRWFDEIIVVRVNFLFFHTVYRELQCKKAIFKSKWFDEKRL